ncbi:alpha/beta fold hydrolase [Spirosoma sp. BT702]|uniref:Alpha/beta fold hydrolase n=1 Tax=Spirosoma profusum TaxID=2771354 RepID=A0A927ANV9_9BACT|nr:alpha/beta fold hydrolase [Spirosoma profusum]MBD2702704.1 alpha/beta fold hydrolase [Spirosoma profusum]
MKKTGKRILFGIIALLVSIFIIGLVLAFFPTKSKTNHIGISPEKAASLRENFAGAHHLFTTSDGETLFLRRWNPDSIDQSKKDIAVLIFHGITAYSGPYNMAGKPISAGGYTTFGLDYRGHGLSGGNRGDSPGKERWIADLVESVRYVKSLGFSRVIILGHSLGVASAICAADAIPDEIAGLVLLSGAYEGRKGVSAQPTFYEKAKIFASSIFRPSYQAAEYYREGMTVTKDPLFNFRYTLRFLTMLNVKELRLPKTLTIPVLVGMGDKDELFSLEKAKEFYDLVPGNKKEFLVMENTTHAKIPVESWNQVVAWLDKTF